MTKSITIFHSPDADDAFMFYGLVSGAVKYPGFNFEHDLSDIESLNQKALRGELDVTAVSVHAFAHLKNQYLILRSGASMGGKDYGPRLVSKQSFNLKDGHVRTFALPGPMTSATLALKLYLREIGVEAELVQMHFDSIQSAVLKGEVDAGLLIHEGQLTHGREGLVQILDLGEWWWNSTGLPLPLGINIVKRDLGPEAIQAVSTVLKDSIEYSLAHRKEALEYALTYGRGLAVQDADKFVGMYVNERTRDIGEAGAKSIKLFLERGVQAGLIPNDVNVEFA